MSIIAATSDALIGRIQTLCGDYLKEVDTHPGQWDDSSVRRIVRNPPAVYVAWLGQIANPNTRTVTARWGLFVVAEVLNGQRQNSVGIYQIVETLTAGLHKQQINPSGSFDLQSVQNLWSDTQSGMGVAVYAMYFNAVQPLADSIDESSLADFKVYNHTFNQDKDPNTIDGKTRLHLILPTQSDNQEGE
ncbi:DUF1834 family protein [Mannheimia haemolytica]|uniref:DUF1834 family protein n=1 Tax=Mannheimia haemolytica TaxID=75985 RepID=UPI0001BCF71F|nr:phage protein Gp37 [Mannheimia haemolytica]EEY13311.1 hypothetical protein COK_0544 [Mannheimia haemolytica serotype A2 str. BOVINE]EPZ00561.1 hypothetical protein L278_00885 [Mannheimia haemolytica D35]MDW0617366.1 DUF1834 family protein [Mannheimia haemolytica]MDW0723588.1 DUF1834 family protein [Mannheimia haemolytica]MDW0736619.1 DUF1834 family protein [Mannheimia haemolytica]